MIQRHSWNRHHYRILCDQNAGTKTCASLTAWRKGLPAAIRYARRHRWSIERDTHTCPICIERLRQTGEASNFYFGTLTPAPKGPTKS